MSARASQNARLSAVIQNLSRWWAAQIERRTFEELRIIPCEPEHPVIALAQKPSHCLSLAISDGVIMINRKCPGPACRPLTDKALTTLSLIDLVVLSGEQSVDPLNVSVMSGFRLLLLDYPLAREAVLLTDPLGAERPLASMAGLLIRNQGSARKSAPEPQQPGQWLPWMPFRHRRERR